MKVTVLLFGHYRELADGGELMVEVNEGTTVHSLADTLINRFSALAGIMTHCRFAVNEEFAPLNASLAENDVVAVLPPMSGG